MFRHFLKIFTFICVLMSASIGILSASVSPAPVKVGSLSLTDLWVRPATGGPNTAAYLTIENSDLTPDVLEKAECDEATTVELHNHIQENGVMRMRPVENITIGKDAIEMKPGGMHIMLMGVKPSFKDKKEVKITLHFKNAKSIDVVFPIVLPSISNAS